jgi:hypothetical protein
MKYYCKINKYTDTTEMGNSYTNGFEKRDEKVMLSGNCSEQFLMMKASSQKRRLEFCKDLTETPTMG